MSHSRVCASIVRSMEATNARVRLPVWVEASRPRTLPASIAPVVVGTAAAARDTILVDRFVLALVVALSLQVAVNFANDYFDGVRGVDTEARVGPRRAVASGLVPPRAMRSAMLVALAVAGLAGLVLAALAGWELLLVGVAALAATIGYSGGPRPYASAGLGEVFVFVFFGVVATAGSQYVQDERLTAVSLLVAVPMGLLATALLVVNNLRDIPTDREVGKVTLAVRLGDRRTRMLYVGLIVAAYLMLIPLLAATRHGWVALPLLSLPIVWPAVQAVRGGATGRDLLGALAITARSQLVFAVLLALALVLRS